MGGDTEQKINPKLTAAFVDSTTNVLKTMMNLDSKIGKPKIKSNDAATFNVSGIVGFQGEIIGNVIISFEDQTAIKLIKDFAMEEYALSDADFADAIGEVCNMIAGNAKKDFGLNVSLGIPTVIIGTAQISRLADVPCVVIPCECDYGNFTVEVNIKKSEPIFIGV